MNDLSPISQPDQIYVPSPDAIALDARLQKSPSRVFIISNRTDGGLWHAGILQCTRGPRSGLLKGVWYVTACSGKKLGGVYGETVSETLPSNAAICPRCESLHSIRFANAKN